MTTSTAELHLFIVWSRGREHEQEILADIDSEFDVLDLLEVSWTASIFSDNLTRFYGEALPSGSEKERHCGNGPFLAVVVRDRRPQLEPRRPNGRRLQVVDVRTLEAKNRYRTLTGGGHRVHATLEPREFAHDLYLLFGRVPSYYDEIESWDGNVTSWRHDAVGSEGWESVDELLTALEVTLGHVSLLEPVSRNRRIRIAVADPWWAAVVANGRPGLRDPWASAHEVNVGRETVQLEFESECEQQPTERRGWPDERSSRLRARLIDLASRLTSHRAGLALVYHGVGDPPGDPRYELVPRLGLEAFNAQVTLLARRYRVVAASELPRAVVSRRRGGRFPVALTFDDNLVSHVRVAAPVLAAAGVQATFFLNGATAERDSFWWEDLQRAFDRQTLDLSMLAGVDGAEVEGVQERRPGALRRLASAIEQLEVPLRSVVVDRLRDSASNDLDRRLTAADVRALAATGFEIGFHTVDHDVLPTLDDDGLRRALETGREALADAAGQPIRVLAYPHGKADARVAEAAQRARYDLAYAGSGRPVHPGAPPTLLPRWEPPFNGGGVFALAVARSLRG